MTTSITPVDTGIPSFIPISLPGNICGYDVDWDAIWEPANPSDPAYTYPILHGTNSGAVIGWNMTAQEVTGPNTPNMSMIIRAGVMTITAKVNGKTLGPIILTIAYGGYTPYYE